MSESAQFYEKLVNDALLKQMIILGASIVLIKARNVPGLRVGDDGTVSILSNNPEEVVTRFLEQFREISAPLVKKTMQPLLSAIEPAPQLPTELKAIEIRTEPKQEQK
jgi:hypothetical protein